MRLVMKFLRKLIFIPAMILVSCLCAASQTGGAETGRSGWKLVWSDEFNAADGSQVDSSKWVMESGGNGWGNDELEYYTARPENSFQQGGNLVIKAVQEKFT